MNIIYISNIQIHSLHSHSNKLISDIISKDQAKIAGRSPFLKSKRRCQNIMVKPRRMLFLAP